MLSFPLDMDNRPDIAILGPGTVGTALGVLALALLSVSLCLGCGPIDPAMHSEVYAPAPPAEAGRVAVAVTAWGMADHDYSCPIVRFRQEDGRVWEVVLGSADPRGWGLYTWLPGEQWTKVPLVLLPGVRELPWEAARPTTLPSND